MIPLLQMTKHRPARVNKYNDYIAEHLVWAPWRKTDLPPGQGVSDLQSPGRTTVATPTTAGPQPL